MSSPRQRLKWAVYTLLFFDFILYLVQDADSAHHTLGADPGLAPPWDPTTPAPDPGFSFDQTAN